jgi:hypothetical protein
MDGEGCNRARRSKSSRARRRPSSRAISIAAALQAASSSAAGDAVAVPKPVIVLRPAAFDRRHVTHSAPLAHAAELLLEATETGKRSDIAAATDQIEPVLMNARMMR